MQTFHNDKLQKKKYLSLYSQAKKEGRLIRGSYFYKDTKQGCFVGLAVQSSDHQRFSNESQIPEWLIRLGETLFENLPTKTYLGYPEALIQAIPVGKDIEIVKHQIAEFCLTKICKNTDHPTIQTAMKTIISLHQRCTEKGISSVSEDDWSAAESAARSAAESAELSARSAAESAARSVAWSAESVAWSAESAAWSARSVAWSAESAAWSAWSAARSAAESARSARSAAYQKMADKLLELLRKVQ